MAGIDALVFIEAVEPMPAKIAMTLAPASTSPSPLRSAQ
jgi:hypothetical protein